MADAPGPGASWMDLAVWFIVGGGAVTLARESRQWWQRRRLLNAAAPERRAEAEARYVATADKVVELVEERMTAQADEIRELKTTHADEMGAIRGEVDRLRRRVGVLEDELRAHNWPIPPQDE